MLHDIDYLINAGDPIGTDKADDRALSNINLFDEWYKIPFMGFLGQPAVLTYAGLNIRKRFQLNFNPSDPNKHMGLYLMKLVKNNAPYKELFLKYGIDPNQYPG